MIVEYAALHSMCQGKYILVNGFPCFVTKSIRFCIISIKNLTLPH
ncbi:MAG: hypothetical protein Q4Q22_04330 [Methanosphaera sp.]|nr:hypothetical protein [Methanosphaera sp.]